MLGVGVVVVCCLVISDRAYARAHARARVVCARRRRPLPIDGSFVGVVYRPAATAAATCKLKKRAVAIFILLSRQSGQQRGRANVETRGGGCERRRTPAATTTSSGGEQLWRRRG